LRSGVGGGSRPRRPRGCAGGAGRESRCILWLAQEGQEGVGVGPGLACVSAYATWSPVRRVSRHSSVEQVDPFGIPAAHARQYWQVTGRWCWCCFRCLHVLRFGEIKMMFVTSGRKQQAAGGPGRLEHANGRLEHANGRLEHANGRLEHAKAPRLLR